MFSIFYSISGKGPKIGGLEAFIEDFRKQDKFCLLGPEKTGKYNLDESTKNIEKGIVTIIRTKEYKNIKDKSDVIKTVKKSSGLLVTDNGYILTTADDLNEKGQQITIIYGGNEYALEKICAIDKNKNTSLLKAKIPGLDTPRKYHISTYQDITGLKNNLWMIGSGESINIRKISRIDTAPKGSGLTVSAYNTGQEDYGSTVITMNAKIVGMINGKVGENVSSVIPLAKTMNLLTRYIYEQKKFGQKNRFYMR